MRYFEKQRRNYISNRVQKIGHINRSDLIFKFGIGPATATRDIQKFIKDFPNLLEYNVTTKRYEIASNTLVAPPHKFGGSFVMDRKVKEEINDFIEAALEG